MNAVVDEIAKFWERWYLRVTGNFAVAMEPGMPGWETVVRLTRRDPTVDNLDRLAALIVVRLGGSAVTELLDAQSPVERGSVIGRWWAVPASRHFAEMLLEVGVDDAAWARLTEALRRTPRLGT
jgi:hypothetical protein